MGWAVEWAAGSHTGEGWEGMRGWDRGPAGGGSVAGKQTWQTQILLLVRKICVLGSSFHRRLSQKYQTNRNDKVVAVQ